MNHSCIEDDPLTWTSPLSFETSWPSRMFWHHLKSHPSHSHSEYRSSISLSLYVTCLVLVLVLSCMASLAISMYVSDLGLITWCHGPWRLWTGWRLTLHGSPSYILLVLLYCPLIFATVTRQEISFVSVEGSCRSKHLRETTTLVRNCTRKQIWGRNKCFWDFLTRQSLWRGFLEVRVGQDWVCWCWAHRQSHESIHNGQTWWRHEIWAALVNLGLINIFIGHVPMMIHCRAIVATLRRRGAYQSKHDCLSVDGQTCAELLPLRCSQSAEWFQQELPIAGAPRTPSLTLGVEQHVGL